MLQYCGCYPSHTHLLPRCGGWRTHAVTAADAPIALEP
jgi:hypothetical protein